MILAAESMVVRVELGIQQSRHSTLNSYLEKLLYLLTGNFGRRGTNAHPHVAAAALPRLAGRALERDRPGDHRRPPADQPLRRRGADRRPAPRPRRLGRVQQPANTAADTTRFEAAFRALELSVVVDVAYTETGRARRLRAAGVGAVREVGGDALHLRVAAELLPPPGAALRRRFRVRFRSPRSTRRLLRAMGDLPERRRARRAARARRRAPRQDDEARLPDVRREPEARADRAGAALRDARPDAARPVRPPRRRSMPPATGRRWSTRSRSSARSRPTAEPPMLGEVLFEKLLASRSGFVFTAHEYDEIFQLVKHRRRQDPPRRAGDARLAPHVSIPPPERTIPRIRSRSSPGQRRMHNANQIFRTPAWRKSDPDGALRIHPDDIAALGGQRRRLDGGRNQDRAARLPGRESIASMRRGLVALPHGYGQSYPDGHGRPHRRRPASEPHHRPRRLRPDRRDAVPQERRRPLGAGRRRRGRGRRGGVGAGRARSRRRAVAAHASAA